MSLQSGTPGKCGRRARPGPAAVRAAFAAPRGARLRRFAPVQDRVQQAAAAEGDKRKRHEKDQPFPGAVASLEHDDAGIRRIIPAGTLPADDVPLDGGFALPTVVRVLFADVPCRIAIDHAVDSVFDADFRSIERCGVLREALDDSLFEHGALVLDELVVDAPLGDDVPNEAANEPHAAQDEESGEKDDLADAADNARAGPAVAAFLLVESEAASQGRSPRAARRRGGLLAAVAGSPRR